MAQPCTSACYSDTYNVLTSVMNAQNYSKLINPFTGTNTPQYIYVFIYLVKLLELDNKGTISIVAGLVLSWADPRLAWNSSAYNKVSVIKIPVDQVWTPDLFLYNGVTDDLAVTFSNRSASTSLNNLGFVSLFTAKRFQATCTVDLTYFPFDSQSCTLRFVSIDLRNIANSLQFLPSTKLAVYTGAYSSIGEFQFVGANLTVGMPRIDSLNLELPGFYLTILNQRNPYFYISNVAVPATMLIVASGLVFLLPSDNSVKIAMACSLMIALYILQQAVSRLLPASPTTPVLSKGIMIALGLGLYSLACSSISVTLCSIQPPLSPCFIKLIASIERTFSCCSKQSQAHAHAQAHAQGQARGNQTVPIDGGTVRKYPAVTTKVYSNPPFQSAETINEKETDTLTKTDEILAAIMQLVQLNKAQTEKAERADAERKKAHEHSRRWKVLDMTLNVIFGLIYVVLAAVSTVLYLFNLTF